MDDQAVNKTIRPTVSMRIVSEGDLASVEEVNLDDEVKMELVLDDPYLSEFTIYNLVL